MLRESLDGNALFLRGRTPSGDSLVFPRPAPTDPAVAGPAQEDLEFDIWEDGAENVRPPRHYRPGPAPRGRRGRRPGPELVVPRPARILGPPGGPRPWSVETVWANGGWADPSALNRRVPSGSSSSEEPEPNQENIDPHWELEAANLERPPDGVDDDGAGGVNWRFGEGQPWVDRPPRDRWERGAW